MFFSPNGHCTEAIVGQIDRAQQSIRVQAYRLTSIPIVKALTAAHDRGVKTIIVLDKRQQSDKYSDATYFHNRGMTVFIDPSHAIAHNKVMIIDESIVITGSFNFSQAAEDSNSENIVILTGKPKLAAAYIANFSQHLMHVEIYRGVGAGGGTEPEVDDDTESAGPVGATAVDSCCAGA